MNSHCQFFLVLGLFASSVALGAFNPQSYLDGDPRSKTDPQLYPVRVVAVDGVRPHDNPVAVTPGAHWLQIRAAPGGSPAAEGWEPREPAIGRSESLGSKRPPKSQTFVLKIEPCTRYFLGAHKDSVLLDKWKLVIDQVETVKGCDPAEELKKFPDPSQAAPKAPAAH